jgi:hypothetical protein
MVAIPVTSIAFCVANIAALMRDPHVSTAVPAAYATRTLRAAAAVASGARVVFGCVSRANRGR